MIAEALRRCRSGRGGVVLISGEAGIGKTRLPEEVFGDGTEVAAAAGHRESAAERLTSAYRTAKSLGAKPIANQCATTTCRMPNAPCSYGHSRLFPVSPFFAHKETRRACSIALARGDVDAVVIAAHGRPMPGLGHYLELGSDVILTPAVMFASTPPKPLALLACWGARFMPRAAATR